MCDLSLIIPVFNEAESLPRLYLSISSTMSDNQIDYEILFVNDGSTDDSVAVIKELITKDKRVGLISFRKNFGKAAALQAGFRHSIGGIIITMDADLQDDPCEIPRFINKLNEGFDLVSGWKQNRLDPLEKRLPSKLFNKVTSLLSGVHLHDCNCGFKAYRRCVVDAIDVYGEMHRYIPVLASRHGFKITEITVCHRQREFGRSKYGLERYLRGFFDSLTVCYLVRYYSKPMYLFGRVGLLFSLFGIGICSVLTIAWLCGGSLSDRPFLLLGVLFILLGAQFFSTGLLADMLNAVTYRQHYTEEHIKEIIQKNS